MAEKKQESFTVTDRRLFTSDGELRQEVSEEEVSTAKPAPPAAGRGDACRDRTFAAGSICRLRCVRAAHPSAAEQKEQADAYRKSAKNSMRGSNSAATPRKKWR